MRPLFKKNYIIFFLLIILLSSSQVYAKNSNIKYTKENISNYFLGIILSNRYYDNQAFKYLKKVESIKDKHSKFNIEFIRTLILLEKFDKAFLFSEEIWNEDELFFEADLLLGLDSFLNKDYIKAEKHFVRLNKISSSNLFFKDFIGNVLIAWSKASQGEKENSFAILKKVPKPYHHLIYTQYTFLKCYFNSEDTQESFEKLIENKEYNFSRYNFFLINYLLSKKKYKEAEIVTTDSRKKYNSNLLIKQTENFFLNKKRKKVNDFFNCQDSKDVLAEFFYVLANLYSSEENYQLSNFYLKISLFLNKKFLMNKALLAENYYNQKQNVNSKNIYYSLKPIGEVYSWYAAQNISRILFEEKGKEHSIKNLKEEFNLLSNPTFEHYFEMANFYKDYQYHEEAIKYYSISLKQIEKNHFLIPRILDRRGTSYERLGDWENAEKDLTESLKILPDQAHVLNYLAYSWIDKGINLDKGIEMLRKASELTDNDGYIIDSLGWAYYAKKNYIQAEFFLQKAVELLPLDPIINDHYADTLWMLNKDIQARFFWKNILNLDSAEEKLKDDINKKLIFGIEKKL